MKSRAKLQQIGGVRDGGDDHRSSDDDVNDGKYREEDFWSDEGSASGSESYSTNGDASRGSYSSSNCSFDSFDESNTDDEDGDSSFDDGNYRGGGGEIIDGGVAQKTFRNRRSAGRRDGGENSPSGGYGSDDKKNIRVRRIGGVHRRDITWIDVVWDITSIFRSGGHRHRRRGSLLAGKKATTVLLMSALVWLVVQIRRARDGSSWSRRGGEGGRGQTRPSNWWPEHRKGPLTDDEREELRKEAERVLGTAAGRRYRGGRNDRRMKRSGGAKPEKLPSGCIAFGWQTDSHPNCNDLHEIDLRVALGVRKGGPVLPDMGRGDMSPDEKGATREQWKNARAAGYVGSGLWRSVWTVDPRGEMLGFAVGGERNSTLHQPAVLKIMKTEHKYDVRNYDRHRRDALVMERLAASRYVVDIYGHCGNTVLTQNAGMTLDKIIFQDDDVELGDATSVHRKEDFSQFTRDTPEGRLQLALDVSRGLAAVHEIPGGPIIHADLQAKQFLVDPAAGVVKLNDFNRCRFMPHANITSAPPCPVRIPSAPGANRSPEEYEGDLVTEKADVYSLANVLYGILTGRRHYEGVRSSDIKQNVKAGRVPPMIDEFIKRSGTSDAKLAELILRAYELNPTKRISASEIVDELEKIFDDGRKEKGSNSSLRKNIRSL